MMKNRIRSCTAVLLTLVSFGTRALAVTADEEAARIEGLAAMEPVQREETAVQPLMAIEKTWDIEDTHAPASSPLVTAMSFVRGAMGADAASRTFYASIGTGAVEWPELEMTACGAEGLNVAWVDDYGWDDPAAAVSSGTAYSLIAWTETEYEYITVTFTGLPMVILHTGDGALPGDEYGPASVQVTSGEYDAVSSVAQVHKRGGNVRQEEKISIRVEFAKQKKKGGYGKDRVSLLGMPKDSDWLLISNESDETLLRNYMGWQLWKKMNPEGDAFCLLESRMVELCVNDAYMGVYALQQRVKPSRELKALGYSEKDLAARLITESNIETRAVRDTSETFYGGWMELRNQPEDRTADDCFAVYDDYLKLCAPAGENQPDDAAFLALSEEHTDIPALMRYFLFFQAAGLGDDNVKNNNYIWAVQKQGKTVYCLSPWDMDQGFNDHGVADGVCFSLTWPVRLLTLDAPGCREALWADWNTQRSTVLSEDAVYAWTEGLEQEMNASGAWLREAARWPGRADTCSLAQDREFILAHLENIERDMKNLWPLPGMTSGE